MPTGKGYVGTVSRAGVKVVVGIISLSASVCKVPSIAKVAIVEYEGASDYGVAVNISGR